MGYFSADTENGYRFSVINLFLYTLKIKKIFRFAKKPKQGLAFLQQKGFVGTEPESIAKFLINEERLNKSMVGDFLSDGDEYVLLNNFFYFYLVLINV